MSNANASPSASSSNAKSPSNARARANTAFWRRTQKSADASASTSTGAGPGSLASPLAAPVQTLPLDTLLQLLAPPSVPSLAHARALVSALQTHTPVAMGALVPVVASLTAREQPPAVRAAGFDVLAAYAAAARGVGEGGMGIGMETGERMLWLGTVPWTAPADDADVGVHEVGEVWAPRLRALNALFGCGGQDGDGGREGDADAEAAGGVEDMLLGVLCAWISEAFNAFCSSCASVYVSTDGAAVGIGDAERAVEALHAALLGWLARLERAGRVRERQVEKVWAMYAGLVGTAVAWKEQERQRRAGERETPTPTPQRESAAQPTTTGRHRRHPSSTTTAIFTTTTTMTTTTNNNNAQNQKAKSRAPVHVATTLVLDALDARSGSGSGGVARLSESYASLSLPVLIPLLFRLLAAVMSPLQPFLASFVNFDLDLNLEFEQRQQHQHQQRNNDNNGSNDNGNNDNDHDRATERRLARALGALLSGPYSTTCLVLLRKSTLPVTAATSMTSDGADTTSDTKATDPDPDSETDTNVHLDAQVGVGVGVALGALRTLRVQVRRVLEERVAMRRTAGGEGAQLQRVGRGVGTAGAWDARTVGRFLAGAVRAWASVKDKETPESESERERVFEEVAGLLKDVMDEMEDRLAEREREMTTATLTLMPTERDEFRDGDTGRAVGQALLEMMAYVRTLRDDANNPLSLSPSNPILASTPLLRTLASLFAPHRCAPAYLDPPAPILLLAVARHLPDVDTAALPARLSAAHLLTPIAPVWLETWGALLDASGPRAGAATRRAVVQALAEVFGVVREMRVYRRRFVSVVFRWWTGVVGRGEGVAEAEAAQGVWKVLGEEVVLRTVEEEDKAAGMDDDGALFTPEEDEGEATTQKILVSMMSVAGDCTCGVELEAAAGVLTLSLSLSPDSTTVGSPPPGTPANTLASGAVSPVLVRTVADAFSPGAGTKEKEAGNNMQQQLMSLLSFGSGSRQHSQAYVPQVSPTPVAEEPSPATESAQPQQQPVSPPASPLASANSCRGLAATTALIDVLLQLAFVDSVMTARQARLSAYLFRALLKLLRTAPCARARVAICQLLVRLRADREHRVYVEAVPAEGERLVVTLAAQIGRTRGGGSSGNGSGNGGGGGGGAEERAARSRQVFERDGRRTSRGRGSRNSATASRSRSRATLSGGIPQAMTALNSAKPREQLWIIPDAVPFALEHAGKSSQLVVTYDAAAGDGGDNSSSRGGGAAATLPVSEYLDVVVELLKTERDWEVLSYLLVHLPSQLANKHFWCGPRAKAPLGNLIAELCRCVAEGTLGRYVSAPDASARAREAQALGYHTLAVLISYHALVPAEVKQAMVEAFQGGLAGRGEGVVVCTHALALCAFEMEAVIVKRLPRILEKLTQIVSNPAMAVHILTFLAMLASLPHVYANFTEADFKMVFAVALQYLQHHNRNHDATTTTTTTSTTSTRTTAGATELQFSLSQHVRILSYYVIYIWFLAVKFPDRPRHVPFIARQLLLANEGQARVDEPTEVCFDFLARYTYANADPKPAPSLLGEILAEGGSGASSEAQAALQEKSWVLGYSIITIRLLAKPGWMEVISRRPSGMTKFLVKSENVPLVSLGDTNPDMATIPASLMMEKDIRAAFGFGTPEALPLPPDVPLPSLVDGNEELSKIFKTDKPEAESQPDPLTGYVWSGEAPSQRRKRVDLDPSYFALQLSAYPDVSQPTSRARIVRDTKALHQTLRVLDKTPVIDTHKVGILYVAPGQTEETEILRNVRGSPAYSRFLEHLGRLIKLRGQQDVYTGGLDPDVDGEYAYAWWDDTGQILYHAATLMPNHAHDAQCAFKKRHIGNDAVRIVWNDSGRAYAFDTLRTEFQFVNIVIEPHSRGAIAAYAGHESAGAGTGEYFRLSVQRAPGMADFAPVGDFKLVSARALPVLMRQLCRAADWYAGVFNDTAGDTRRTEVVTNWRRRLDYIKKFAATVSDPWVVAPSQQAPQTPQQSQQPREEEQDAIMGQEPYRDFTSKY